MAKYYSIDEHIRVPEILIASKVALSKLNDQDMAILYEAARETQDYQRLLWEASEKDSEEAVRNAGVVVNYIEDRSAFREAMAPLYEKYAGDYMDVIDKIRDMR